MIYVATFVVTLVGSVVSIDSAARYSEPAWLLDVVLYAVFLFGFTIVRRRARQAPTMHSDQ